MPGARKRGSGRQPCEHRAVPCDAVAYTTPCLAVLSGDHLGFLFCFVFKWRCRNAPPLFPLSPPSCLRRLVLATLAMEDEHECPEYFWCSASELKPVH